MEISQELETAATLASENRVIPRGTLVFEVDTGKAKMGDGARSWNALSYWDAGAAAALATTAAATYDPIPASIYVPARQLQARSGSTNSEAVTNGLGIPVVNMTETVTSAIAVLPRLLPSTWATFNVSLEWANATTAEGVVSFRFYTLYTGPGDDVTQTYTNHGSVALTAGTQNILTRSTLASGIAVNSSKRLQIQLFRRGGASGDAEDTLAAACNVVGILLTKAS